MVRITIFCDRCKYGVDKEYQDIPEASAALDNETEFYYAEEKYLCPACREIYKELRRDIRAFEREKQIEFLKGDPVWSYGPRETR